MGPDRLARSLGGSMRPSQKLKRSLDSSCTIASMTLTLSPPAAAGPPVRSVLKVALRYLLNWPAMYRRTFSAAMVLESDVPSGAPFSSEVKLARIPSPTLTDASSLILSSAPACAKGTVIANNPAIISRDLSVFLNSPAVFAILLPGICSIVDCMNSPSSLAIDFPHAPYLLTRAPKTSEHLPCHSYCVAQNLGNSFTEIFAQGFARKRKSR